MPRGIPNNPKIKVTKAKPETPAHVFLTHVTLHIPQTKLEDKVYPAYTHPLFFTTADYPTRDKLIEQFKEDTFYPGLPSYEVMLDLLTYGLGNWAIPQLNSVPMPGAARAVDIIAVWQVNIREANGVSGVFDVGSIQISRKVLS